LIQSIDLPSSWIQEIATDRSGDQSVQIFTQIFRSEPWASPRALVVVHGIGEHGGRYSHLPRALSSEVSAIVLPDHRGHGRSEGLRGDAPHFDRLAEDIGFGIRRLEAQLIERFGKSEIHLLGHSMGGLVTLRLLQLYPTLPLKSVTLSAPFLGIQAEIPWFKKAASRLLNRVWSTLQIPSELDTAAISQRPEVVAAYQADRLVHSKITPRFFESMMAVQTSIFEEKYSCEFPIQFLIPMKDRLVSSERSLDFYARLDAPKKRLQKFENSFHEILNDLESEQGFLALRNWINEHGSN
jgi:alpha-beta hydrolase superfamily lysophospholipase